MHHLEGHMLYIPLTTSPVGWVILAAGGYALYKAGKRKGQEEAAASKITAAPPEAEEKPKGKGEK